MSSVQTWQRETQDPKTVNQQTAPIRHPTWERVSGAPATRLAKRRREEKRNLRKQTFQKECSEDMSTKHTSTKTKSLSRRLKSFSTKASLALWSWGL